MSGNSTINTQSRDITKPRFRLSLKSGRWVSCRNDQRRDYLLTCIDCRGLFTAGTCKSQRCFECRQEWEASLRDGCRGAHRAVMEAIRTGVLKPAYAFLCADCRNEHAEVYDHRDYSKPLDVDPVCRRCNALRGPGKRVEARAS